MEAHHDSIALASLPKEETEEKINIKEEPLPYFESIECSTYHLDSGTQANTFSSEDCKKEILCSDRNRCPEVDPLAVEQEVKSEVDCCLHSDNSCASTEINYYPNLTKIEDDSKSYEKILPRAFNHAIFHAMVYKETQWDIRLLVNIFDKDGVVRWVAAFTELSKSFWSVRSTPSVKGKTVLFKRRYGCIHSGRYRDKVNTEATPNIRNTNCPAILQFVVSAVNWKSRAKRKTDPKMPCEIYLRLSHNHPLHSDDALRFRPLSAEIKDKLRMLFRSGYTAATALDSIKLEIKNRNPDNFDVLLADRSQCPDYQSCYRLYMKEKMKEQKLK